jgi:hypothetical protein
MGVLSAVSVSEIKARGSIKDADVLKLRRSYYDDGRITAEEADALFALNDACPVQDPAWADYSSRPSPTTSSIKPTRGYLTAANAAWLIERVSRDGRVETKTELELLVNVLDKARWAPQSLVTFALAQVKDAVINGSGVLRNGKQFAPGVVTEGDVDLLRRVLYAYGGRRRHRRHPAGSRVLFDIDGPPPMPTTTLPGAICSSRPSPMRRLSGYAAPAREIALARDAWLDRRGDLALGSIVSGMGTGMKNFLTGYRKQTSEERAITRLTQQKIEIVTNEGVTVAEAAWLAERIGRDGQLTPNEQALLMFLKADSGSIHPALRDLVKRAAAAA